METSTHDDTHGADARKPDAKAAPPRLWPAYLILLLQAGTIGISITPALQDGLRFAFMVAGPLGCLVLFLVWLLDFSRLPWRERLGSVAVAALLATTVALAMDKSMGVSLWIYGVPLSLCAITAGNRALREGRPKKRFALVCLLLAIALSPFTLIRLDGFQGNYLPELAWRWSPTAEDGLQADAPSATVPPNPAYAAWTPSTVEWPGFRGPTADSRVADSGLDGAWSTAPTVLWRVPIGPAWSSFALVSGRLFTQEQRGEEEAVTCLDAATGTLIWRTAYPCRFSDVVSGAGPRATPTYVDGRLYTYGGRATLSCLDAATGATLWQHDLMAEVNAQLPVWGFSSSPLVLGSLVIVYAGGDGDNGLMAFDRDSGTPVWRFASHGMNFSSAQRVTFAGQDLVLFGDDAGLAALEPASGALVWRHKPNGWRGPALCQPQQIAPESILAPLGDGTGIVRLDVTRNGAAWNIAERWSSKQLKPSFNDFVYWDGFCYGFDNNAFACLNTETGALQWKHRGYGFGQVVLLADAEKLILTTEKGEVVLLAADPAQHRELARFPVLEGKTWNHPIAAAGRLFVRNGSESAAVALSSQLASNR